MFRVVAVTRQGGSRRLLHIATRPLLQKAEKPAAAAASAVDPNDPIIAPAAVSWREYKNEYFKKRGYTLAPKDWTEWSDLPAPYKYLGVKVDPKHVEGGGVFWKAFADWKMAVPIAALVGLPLWIGGYLPGIDERMELSLITILAGTVVIKEVGPMFTAWKRSAVEPKIKAMYEAEKALNDELSHALDVFKSGQAIPATMKTVHEAERSLRKAEAEAATRKLHIAQRDALVAQLDYLVQLRQGAASATEGAVIKAARSAVEASLEKDKDLQQKSIDAAIKALKEGASAPTDDVVGPLFTKAMAEQSKKAAAATAATNPFTDPQQVEMFRKRFGLESGKARQVNALAFVNK